MRQDNCKRMHLKGLLKGWKEGKNNMLVVWLFAVSMVKGEEDRRCPPEVALSTCRCIKMAEVTILNCVNVVNIWDFIQDLDAVKEYDIHQVNLWQVNFQYIPAGFLKYSPIHSLTIRESIILALESQDGKVMFEGADESLEEIFILAVEGVSSWRWKPLEALKNLKKLILSTCDIKSVLADFNLLSKSLQEISLNNNKISFVHDEAFSNYDNLKILDLTRNQIAEIKRSMFPNPAKELELLKLSVNNLDTLPDDIFTNMPQLKELYINANKIKWLPAKPFEPVHLQLIRFELEDNDIYCCTGIEWIIESPVKKYVIGKCIYPQMLSGKKISSLDASDLNHGMC